MSDTGYSPEPFNWALKPAPGYPGYQPQTSDLVDRPGRRRSGDYPTNDLVDRPQDQVGMYRRLPDSAGSITEDSPSTIDQPPSNEPYIGSRSDRPYHQWGTDDFALAGARNYPGMAPAPLMPQPNELAGLLHGIVMGMGRYGSRYSGMPAIAMGTYASAYWAAYQKGMHERANQSWQQYQQAHQMFLDRQKEEFQAESEAYATYQDNPEKLHDALMQLAHRFNDTSLQNALESGNPAAVDRLLQLRDKHWADAAKIKQQQEAAKRKQQADEQIARERDLRIKEMEEREKANEAKRKALEDARKRIDPGATGPGPGYTPDLGEPGATPPPEPGEAAPGDEPGSEPPAEPGSAPPPEPGAAADAPASAADAEPPDDSAQSPVQVADASGRVPIGGAQAGAEPSKAVGFGPEGKPETPVLEDAAKNWVFTHKLPASIDKKNFPDLAARGEARGAELERYLNKLANDPRVTSDQMRSELHRLFPGFANTVEKAIAGDIPPPRSLGASNQAYWNLLYNVGAKIDPKFTADTFAERAKARIFWTSGPGGTKMTILGAAFDHLNDLAEMTRNGDKPAQLTAGVSEWWATHFGRIGKFSTTLATALHEYENALSASGTGGGSATIPQLKDATKELTINQNNQNFLDNIEQKKLLLRQKLGEMFRQYESSTGRPAEEIVKRFRDYAAGASPAFKDLDPKFSDDLSKAGERIDRVMKYQGEGAGQGGGVAGEAAPKEGDRKQFKQGWGVFRNGNWVPESK